VSINIIHFEHQGRAQWGVVREGRITAIAGTFANTAAFVRSADLAALSALTGATLDETDVTLLSPVTRDQQFVCQGANYRQHMVESGMDPDAKTYNMIFTKASSCIVPANHDVIRPRHVQCLDYEIELGLVLRRDISAPVRVTDADLHELIAGVVVVNDYSARDIQVPQTQFYKGKSYRTFGPVGPYLCLLDRADFAALRNLDLRLTVNGEIRQRDNTSNLVYSPSETLTELSGVHDLYAGDLIATGTPAGCALSVPSPVVQKLGALLPERTKWQIFTKMQARRPQYLKPGDIVEARIASPDGRVDLGTQRNVVVADAS
jgi:2-keto-4-pentenoate hydratase/2-oxohepta-3-ene-1,7-dioic acid hydratase in catechol pathway